MNTPIVHLPIDSITVGDRLRDDMGDIAALAESIREHGLLHPITVDEEGVLIAGGRRLAAMRRLGFETVPARHWQTLDENDRRLIELEENLQRKDLTSYERSKNVTELQDTAARVIDMETGEVLPESGKTSKGGRPPKSRVSEQAVAERIGIPRQTIRDAKQHVAAAERHSFLQRPEWNQSKALEADRSLNAIPEDERDAVAKMVDGPGIPPDRAISMIRNVASKPPEERKEIVRLAVSNDERDRSLAKARAAEKPPMPDPRRALLKDAMTAIRKAISLFPDDPEVPELESIHEQIEAVRDGIRKERINDSLNAAD